MVFSLEHSITLGNVGFYRREIESLALQNRSDSIRIALPVEYRKD